MSITSHTTMATAIPGTMLTRNNQCHEKVSVKNPPIVGPIVDDRFRIREISTINVASCGPRNFVYITGNTEGVIAPPQNPCSARYRIICPRLVAVAQSTLATVNPAVAETNSTRVDNSRDKVPEN